MFGNRLEDFLDNIGNVVVLEIIFLTPVADKRGCRVRPADSKLSASASFHQRILVSSELLDYQVRSGNRGAGGSEGEGRMQDTNAYVTVGGSRGRLMGSGEHATGQFPDNSQSPKSGSNRCR